MKWGKIIRLRVFPLDWSERKMIEKTTRTKKQQNSKIFCFLVEVNKILFF